MKKTITITDENKRSLVIDFVQKIPLEPVHQVRIEPFEGNRSADQNRLYWMWLTDASTTCINEHAGKTKDEWHLFFKRKFLIPIFIRDDEGFAKMIVATRALKAMDHLTEYHNLRKGILNLTSITDANVKQMAEYLYDIELFLHGCGVVLRTDDELYKRAME